MAADPVLKVPMVPDSIFKNEANRLQILTKTIKISLKIIRQFISNTVCQKHVLEHLTVTGTSTVKCLTSIKKVLGNSPWGVFETFSVIY